MWRLAAVTVVLVLSGCLGPAPGNDDASNAVNGPGSACNGALQGLNHPCLADGLGLGEHVFWDGGALPNDANRFAERHRNNPSICDELQSGGSRHELSVAALSATEALHVDLRMYMPDPQNTRPTADMMFGVDELTYLALFAPDGSCVASSSTLPQYGTLAIPLQAPAAAYEAGIWVVVFDGSLADWFHVLLRAHVAAPVEPTMEPALPDLVIIPPFEIGFNVASISMMPGVPTATPLGPSSCMVEEFEEAQGENQPLPVLCLRYSMGLGNLGPGEFLLRGYGDSNTLQQDIGFDTEPLAQVVCAVDGTQCQDADDVLGLQARYHTTHNHLHYQNAYIYDLYAVVEDGDGDGDGGDHGLEFVVTSGKLGLNPTNEVWMSWDRFDEQPQDWSPPLYADGSQVPWTQRIGGGWGDIYDWTRSGNFVDFPRDVTGLPLAGNYVLRGVTDPLEQIVESNETNNAAYAYFSVSALGEVTLRERGYGTDPWDPFKQLITVAP